MPETVIPKQSYHDDTVDPSESAYYEQLADRWWDLEGPFWPLHRLNAFRTEYLRQVVCDHFGVKANSHRPLRGLDILDIGCGGGILAESMAALGARVTGIDVVEKNIRVARMHAKSCGLEIDYRHCAVSDLIHGGSRWDVVLNMEVIEHVSSHQQFMTQTCSLVGNRGLLVMATINRTLRSWLFAIVGAEYVLRWLPRGTHQWNKFRRPAELADIVEGESLQVVDRMGVRVNPFNRSFLLTDNLDVNYMLVASRPHIADIVPLHSKV